MLAYFVDTWFFIAFLNERDSHHLTALRLARTLHDTSFVTHDGVLSELLAFFSGYGSAWRREVGSLVRDVLSSRKYKVTPLDRHLFEEGLTLYEHRLDKNYSLIDCVSMQLMLRRDIKRVLTNDHHFEQEGFVLVNE